MLTISGKINLDKLQKQFNRVETQVESRDLNVGYFDELHNKRGQINVASISLYTEYGSLRKPPFRAPRPFMSRAHSQFQSKLAIKSARFLEDVLVNRNSGTKAVAIVGNAYVEEIQKSILDGGFARLRDSTIEQKGHDTQLIDTEQLYEATKYKFKSNKSTT